MLILGIRIIDLPAGQQACLPTQQQKADCPSPSFPLCNLILIRIRISQVCIDDQVLLPFHVHHDGQAFDPILILSLLSLSFWPPSRPFDSFIPPPRYLGRRRARRGREGGV